MFCVAEFGKSTKALHIMEKRLSRLCAIFPVIKKGNSCGLPECLDGNWVAHFISTVFALVVSGTAFAQVHTTDGEYLTRIAGCRDCHSVNFSLSMSGGLALESPFGDFYAPNITPDRTGVGEWTFDDFVRAMRYGESPRGDVYYPSFPYRSYSKITDNDLRRIYDYIMSQPPEFGPPVMQDLSFPFNQRWLMRFWRLLYFSEIKADPEENVRTGVGPFVPVLSRSLQWNRGAYLVEALLHCTECHTPRNQLGALRSDRWMSGAVLEPSGDYAPNITPSDDGLANWTAADWRRFLTSGFTPSGGSVGGEMARVVPNTAALRDSDREAVIDYLMSLEPRESVP